jgi:hypothetical protein
MKTVADIPPVPKQQFEDVIRALLTTRPLPMSDIPRKRSPKAKRRPPKR